MPLLTAPNEEKLQWLLTENWKCYVGGSGYDLSQCHTLSAGDPVFKLHQAGFLSWLNERGRQCVNHVTGKFHQVTTNSNGHYQYIPPSATSSGTTTHECWQECLVPNSSKCISCVVNQVHLHPDMCVTGITEAIMKDALTCQASLASEMVSESYDIDYPRMWATLQSKPGKKRLSPALVTIIIILALVILVTSLIVLQHYYYHGHLRRMNDAALLNK
jgi:hypothetical protein